MADDVYRNPHVQADVDDPQWSRAGKVHDWRNHVGPKVKVIWNTFTPEQRMILADDADERAGREEWE